MLKYLPKNRSRWFGAGPALGLGGWAVLKDGTTPPHQALNSRSSRPSGFIRARSSTLTFGTSSYIPTFLLTSTYLLSSPKAPIPSHLRESEQPHSWPCVCERGERILISHPSTLQTIGQLEQRLALGPTPVALSPTYSTRRTISRELRELSQATVEQPSPY